MALALDGTPVNVNSGSAGSVTTPAFATANGSGVIVVVAVANNGTSLTVTGSGLTFAQRAKQTTLFSYVAPYTSNFSGTITVDQGGANFISACVFAVSGCPTTSEFDTNASCPGKGPTGASISTDNANDFIYGVGVRDSATPGAGFTLISSVPGNFLLVQYQIVSATQSGLAYSDSGGSSLTCIIDAIVQSSAAGFFARNYYDMIGVR